MFPIIKKKSKKIINKKKIMKYLSIYNKIILFSRRKYRKLKLMINLINIEKRKENINKPKIKKK